MSGSNPEEETPFVRRREPTTPKGNKVAFLIGEEAESSEMETVTVKSVNVSDTTIMMEGDNSASSDELLVTPEPTDEEDNDKLLIELFDLSHFKDDEWVEAARWVKYEEDVEGLDPHWGRPHVSCLFYENIQALIEIMKDGIFINDIKAVNYSELTNVIEQNISQQAGKPFSDKLAELMRTRQKHVGSHNIKRSMTTLGFSQLSRSMAVIGGTPQLRSNPGFNRNHEVFRSNPELLTCLGSTESAQVYAGDVPEAQKPQMVFVRLPVPTCYPEVEDNPLPVRFFVFILGPPLHHLDYHELGRSFCTMLANKDFRIASHSATKGDHLIRALKRFLNSSVLIPPGEIDSKDLIRVDSIRKTMNAREKARKIRFENAKISVASMHLPRMEMLVKYREKTEGIFRELCGDFRRRIYHYKSDWTDGFKSKCIVTVLFMFMAAISPAITFGGLLGEYTAEAMGVFETLISMSLGGIMWSIFSAQPLVIVSPTGPVLIFEGCLRTLCDSYNLDLMEIRVMVGIMVFLISVIVVAKDQQKHLTYVTKFTEDIFNTLISLIFMIESFKFMRSVFVENPVSSFSSYFNIYAQCVNSKANTPSTMADCMTLPHPNSALMCLLIALSTFALATCLKCVRESKWFGRTFRNFFGDFSVALALLIVNIVVFLFFSDVYVQRLDIPATLGYTNEAARGHGLFVFPRFDEKTLLKSAISVFGGILLYIIIFVETGLVELLLACPSRKLKKGCGKAWDLVLIGMLTVLMSFLGLPWMCPACVQSLAHVNSLTVRKKKAPGEPDLPVGVIEQRVTNLVLSLLVGLFTLLGDKIRIPMACLFGVFLYLGLFNLIDLDLFKRTLLLFQPAKYHPKVPYVEYVTTRRMHGFTILQLFLVAVVMTCKMIKQISPLFPLVLAMFVVIRHCALPWIFSENELAVLDDGENEEDGLHDETLSVITPV